MEVINDSSKYVAQAKELILQYLGSANNAYSDYLLEGAVKLLDKTIDILTKT